jgi:threonine/homoserine/homoserine lactone efflux protein
MPERVLWVVLAGSLAGLFFGIFMAQESHRRKKVRGGLGAQVFHYLASSSFSTILPMVFIGLGAGLGFLQLVGIGLTFSALTFLFLFGYALFEHRVKPEEEKIVRILD